MSNQIAINQSCTLKRKHVELANPFIARPWSERGGNVRGYSSAISYSVKMGSIMQTLISNGQDMGTNKSVGLLMLGETSAGKSTIVQYLTNLKQQIGTQTTTRQMIEMITIKEQNTAFCVRVSEIGKDSTEKVYELETVDQVIDRVERENETVELESNQDSSRLLRVDRRIIISCKTEEPTEISIVDSPGSVASILQPADVYVSMKKVINPIPVLLLDPTDKNTLKLCVQMFNPNCGVRNGKKVDHPHDVYEEMKKDMIILITKMDMYNDEKKPRHESNTENEQKCGRDTFLKDFRVFLDLEYLKGVPVCLVSAKNELNEMKDLEWVRDHVTDSRIHYGMDEFIAIAKERIVKNHERMDFSYIGSSVNSAIDRLRQKITVSLNRNGGVSQDRYVSTVKSEFIMESERTLRSTMNDFFSKTEIDMSGAPVPPTTTSQYTGPDMENYELAKASHGRRVWKDYMDHLGAKLTTSLEEIIEKYKIKILSMVEKEYPQYARAIISRWEQLMEEYFSIIKSDLRSCIIKASSFHSLHTGSNTPVVDSDLLHGRFDDIIAQMFPSGTSINVNTITRLEKKEIPRGSWTKENVISVSDRLKNLASLVGMMERPKARPTHQEISVNAITTPFITYRYQPPEDNHIIQTGNEMLIRRHNMIPDHILYDMIATLNVYLGDQGIDVLCQTVSEYHAILSKEGSDIRNEIQSNINDLKAFGEMTMVEQRQVIERKLETMKQ